MAENSQSSKPPEATSSSQRRLAVIMFTDIVAYTDLMGRDRDRALDLLLRNKEIHKTLVEKHHGQLRKEVGDGNMCTFDTASDAIDCAISLQQEANNVEDLNLRIGIHLGEIVIEEGDAFGDGVNIASRLQSIADPGDIYISDSIQKAIRGRVDVETTDLGERQLKNVDYLLRVYQLQGKVKQRPDAAGETPLTRELSRRDVWRAGVMYVILGLLLWKVSEIAVGMLGLFPALINVVMLLLIIGFPIAVGMAWFYEMSPKGLVRIGSKEARDNPFSSNQRKPLTSNAYIGVLFATFLVLFFIFPSKPSGPAAGMEASEASVAIIPFLNSTGNQELDHYGMGLASEIRTQLAINKQFDFISSMQATAGYKNSSELPRDIGQKLGVTHILSGMYQGNESTLQVVVELVEAATGKIVWSLPYKSKYEDLFVLQASIAERVMAKFNGENVERPVPTFNMEAFAELTRGREAAVISNDPVVRLESNKFFEDAIKLDSGLLAAWVGLIGNYSYHYFNRPADTTVTPEMIKPLVEYVDKHFKNSWEKNQAKGIYAYWVERDYEKGKQLFLEVLKENPDARSANGLLNAIYRRRMQYQEGLPYISRAARINNSPVSWRELGLVFRDNGDYENAEIAFRTTVKLNKNMGGSLYSLKQSLNALEDLPEVTKQQFGKRYQADLLWQQRDYNSLQQFLSNVEPDSTLNELQVLYYRALSSFGHEEADSASFYARKYMSLREQSPEMHAFGFNNSFSDADMHGILGEPINAMESFGAPEGQIEQDLYFQILITFVELNHMILGRDYENATHKLKQMNRDFPNWGNYIWLNQPIYDRIKEEHPPFQEAINGLRLPPKILETNPMKM